ncbi:lipopolysaccharide heptosyltransferase II [Ferruginibacter profundus]
MSTAFVKAVQQQYPGAAIDIIAKKGIAFLADYFPAHNRCFIFNKEEYPGLTGAYKFGRQIQKQKKYDIFFCLPDSLSSAVMGLAVGAKKRVGYKKELRAALLTNAYQKKKNIHRVEEYVDLLQQFLNKEIKIPPVELKSNAAVHKNAVIVNINSEAGSRRLPKEKAVSVINLLRKNIDNEIILAGSNKEASFVEAVFTALENTNNISNMAGKTNLNELISLLGSCTVMLTTDSGPAHVANALGTHTIVLFGAGNENNTAPYNQHNRTIIRLGALPCEPCVSNTCKVYGTPECLLRLDDNLVVQNVITVLKNKKHN